MPEITAATDAIVKNSPRRRFPGSTSHILKGDVPTCQPGRILGHEGVGIIDKIGPAVTAFKPGDHVLISCVERLWQMRLLPETDVLALHDRRLDPRQQHRRQQAEFVRTPYADTSLYPRPDGADEVALVMLSDILTTGFVCGVLIGKVQPGSTVAIVGSGPVGLAVLLTAQFFFTRPRLS